MISNEVILFNSRIEIGQIILPVAIICWLLINYSFFFNVTVTRQKKSLKVGISGSWLLTVFSVQAIAVLMIYSGDHSETAIFIATCLFFYGLRFLSLSDVTDHIPNLFF